MRDELADLRDENAVLLDELAALKDENGRLGTAHQVRPGSANRIPPQIGSYLESCQQFKKIGVERERLLTIVDDSPRENICATGQKRAKA